MPLPLKERRKGYGTRGRSPNYLVVDPEGNPAYRIAKVTGENGKLWNLMPLDSDTVVGQAKTADDAVSPEAHEVVKSQPQQTSTPRDNRPANRRRTRAN